MNTRNIDFFHAVSDIIFQYYIKVYCLIILMFLGIIEKVL